MASVLCQIIVILHVSVFSQIIVILHFNTIKYKQFGLCSAHRIMQNVAAINDGFGVPVVYMTWTEQRAIENVGSIGTLVRNIDQ